MSQLNLGDSLILDTDYSTTEKKTGATWTDGKPIYRRVFTATNQTKLSSTALSVDFDVSLLNIDRLVNYCGYISRDVSGTEYQMIIPVSFAVNSNNVVQISVGLVLIDGITLSLAIGGSLSMTIPKIELVVEYTKTTD